LQFSTCNKKAFEISVDRFLSGGQIADFYQYFKSTIGSMVFLSRSSLVVILYIGNSALNAVTTVIVIWNLFKSQVAKLYKDKAVKFLKTD